MPRHGDNFFYSIPLNRGIFLRIIDEAQALSA